MKILEITKKKKLKKKQNKTKKTLLFTGAHRKTFPKLNLSWFTQSKNFYASIAIEFYFQQLNSSS